MDLLSALLIIIDQRMIVDICIEVQIAAQRDKERYLFLVAARTVVRIVARQQLCLEKLIKELGEILRSYHRATQPDALDSDMMN